jgi:hypothetical protein
MRGWCKVVLGGVTGGTLIVGGALLFAILADLADGTVTDWLALWKLFVAVWALGMIVAGTYYWQHSPMSREVWTDDQREAYRALAGKAGQP